MRAGRVLRATLLMRGNERPAMERGLAWNMTLNEGNSSRQLQRYNCCVCVLGVANGEEEEEQ